MLVITACGGATPNQPTASRGASLPASAAGEWFTDGTTASGLTFTHVNGMSGKFHIAEIIGPGAALLDYDDDGDLDVYLPQGGTLGAGVPSGRGPATGRLFRNDLAIGPDGARVLRFTDVTGASQILSRGYGMGVATGDFDNDGCTDLYLTNLGANQLFRNNCDGTFADVSKRSHADDASWSVSASFLDYDRDGWLDLFVGNYLDWRIASSRPCLNPAGDADYCAPSAYPAQPSRLYRNNRDGTFADRTAESGIGGAFGPALGVSTADVNGDGWIDIFVANDGQANQLWINQRNGTFKDMGLLSGTALSAHGVAKAGMGVDAGDIDNDGDEDLFVANLTGEGNDLYVNDGSGLFEEQSARSGLGVASRAYTGFGTAWFDADNDGRLDTLTVNGAVRTIEALRRANDPFPLHQRKLLFHNRGDGRFEDVTASHGGAVFQLSEVGRGAAFGDIDNDGDVDILVANNNGPTRLLVNGVGNRNHWIGLRLVGQRAQRDMLGARVGVVLKDAAGTNGGSGEGAGSTLWRRARADGSYASANDPRVLVGLGQAAGVFRVRVEWPGGTTEEWSAVQSDRYSTLREGEGK